MLIPSPKGLTLGGTVKGDSVKVRNGFSGLLSITKALILE